MNSNFEEDENMISNITSILIIEFWVHVTLFFRGGQFREPVTEEFRVNFPRKMYTTCDVQQDTSGAFETFDLYNFFIWRLMIFPLFF